jgi:two-component system capsular synthesis sensor histidine kinase RcsC
MLDEGEAVILCGEGDTWHADDENRLVERASWVIDCSAEGAAHPVAKGRFVSVSSYGSMGLASALQHRLQAVPLESVAETPQLLPHRLKVLVAEDNAANRRLFEEQLKRLACDAVLVEDGKRALAWLSRQIFDVLVTDPSMPEMDDYALAREARKRWPVMAATTATTPEERKRCTALEARIRSGGSSGLPASISRRIFKRCRKAD